MVGSSPALRARRELRSLLPRGNNGLKILQVTPYFSPAWAYGGLPRSVSELCYALVRRNHEVTVLTTDALSATARMPATYQRDGLEIYYQRNLSNYLVWNHQLLLPVGALSFLRKHVGEFDAVHVHGFRMIQSILVHKYAIAEGVPYIVSAHGGLPNIVRKIPEKTVFDLWFGERFLQDSTMVISLSKAEKREYELRGIPSSKIAIIYNGVDPSPYENLPPRGLFSSRFGLQGRKIICYVGRLNARKGLDTLARAFSWLAKERQDVALLLVGEDDGYQAPLERLLSQLAPAAPVIFTGLVTFPEKVSVLIDSDVIVYPGHHEFFGLVPFEALLCERPVVVSDDSGCGEIVSRMAGGIVVPNGNVRALQAAIDASLRNGPDIVEATRRGASFVRTEMDWRRIPERVEDVYARAI